jgi:hypothetical protein
MTSPWTHAVCSTCWQRQRGSLAPVRVREEAARVCCYCLDAAAGGIWVREAPGKLACQGRWGVHGPRGLTEREATAP